MLLVSLKEVNREFRWGEMLLFLAVKVSFKVAIEEIMNVTVILKWYLYLLIRGSNQAKATPRLFSCRDPASIPGLLTWEVPP